MPHYPLDSGFERSIPAELTPCWREWKDAQPDAPLN